MLKLLEGVRSTLVGCDFCLVKGLFGEDLGDEPVSSNIGNDFVDDVDWFVFESNDYHHRVYFNKD